MKSDSILALRAAETISLSDSQRNFLNQSDDDLSTGNEIDDGDKLSKGSDCCAAEVYLENGHTWCSQCGEQATETFEDDDEYLERIATQQEEKKEKWEAIDFGDDYGYA